MATASTTVVHDPQERFRLLVAQWKERSRPMSNIAQMAMLKPYQQIIGMGKEALPLLLRELAREPDHWFWALEAITQENPVPQAALGNVCAMADAWLDWAQRHGIDVA
jgi:hypothetical protein